EDGREFPESKAELYEQAVFILMLRWDQIRNISRRDRTILLSDNVKVGSKFKELSSSTFELLLCDIAYTTFKKYEYFFKSDYLVGSVYGFLLKTKFRSASFEDARQAINIMESHYGLIIERARQIYSFSHLNLQEYFTAKYIVNHDTPAI